jgi:SAM-dependent methyltransferase
MADYRTVNRANWDERAPAHAASPDYALDRFAADRAFISDVVRFDVPRLGDVAGLRGVHLQCHIGTDTISLARRGARMIGLDFSPASIEQARALAQRLGEDASFVEAEVHDAVERLGEGAFDLVYTGVGALCWLPDIRRWAGVVAALLAPGGRLFLREGHPVLWALDDERTDGVVALEYPYFEHAEASVWTEPGTYVTTDAQFAHNEAHNWNRGLGEIVTALLDAGMRLTALVEHDTVPWEAVPGMRRIGGGEWQLADRPERLPHSYTLQAVKGA